jgi:hypothetical protein
MEVVQISLIWSKIVKRMFDFIRKLFKESPDGVESSLIKTKIQKEKIISNDTSIQFGKITDRQVGELLKKATALKKIDIEESIRLIKSALVIDPDYPCHFKLTSYLVLANRIAEADGIFIELIQKCSSNDDIFNFNARSDVYVNYSDFHFKNKDYRQYIYYRFLSEYNSKVWQSLSDGIYEVDVKQSKLGLAEEGVDKKVSKAFEGLNVSMNQNTFFKTYYLILMEFDFSSLHKLAFTLTKNKKRNFNFDIEQHNSGRADWQLWSNKEFNDKILLYDENVFKNQYKTKLEALLDCK